MNIPKFTTEFTDGGIFSAELKLWATACNIIAYESDEIIKFKGIAWKIYNVDVCKNKTIPSVAIQILVSEENISALVELMYIVSAKYAQEDIARIMNRLNDEALSEVAKILNEFGHEILGGVCGSKK